ncbi:MAG: hypothetical protein ACQGVC_22935 [Myxococcota bacterium]
MRSERGFPWALCVAVIVTLGIGVVLAATAPRYADSQSLVYLEKLRRAEQGPPVDVMILGASQTVAAIQPDVLAKALPAGTRVYNFGAPAMAPSGGEVLLRRYLDRHPPPRLLVMSFAPMMYGDRRGEFERFTLKDALGLREVWWAIRADGRPGYLLGWLSTRLGTVRFRDGLRSGLLAGLLDRLPALRSRVQRWMGVPDDNEVALYRFDWRYTDRAARNRDLLRELEAGGGWHSWKENAFGGRYDRGTPGWRDGGEPAPVESFEASPREMAAVERILALCAQHGIAVYVPTMPHPSWFAQALRSGPGETGLEALWSGLRSRPGVRVGPTPLQVYPQRLFSDSMHLDPRGAARFSRELSRPVARAYAAARGG